MFCTNCGSQIADGLKFCTQCGKPVGAPPVPPTNPPNERHTKRNILIAGGAVVIAVAVILIFSTSRIAIISDSAGVVMLDGKETKYTIQRPGTITIYNWPSGSFSVSLKTDNGTVIQAVNSAWVHKGKTAKVYIFTDLSKAIKKYTDMIKLTPDDAELFLVRGLIYSAMSNRRRTDDEKVDAFYASLFVDQDFDEALRLAPNNRFVKETIARVRR
jgi:hypothetical protein